MGADYAEALGSALGVSLKMACSSRHLIEGHGKPFQAGGSEMSYTYAAQFLGD